MVDTIGVKVAGIQNSPIKELLKNDDPGWTLWSHNLHHSNLDEIQIKSSGSDAEKGWLRFLSEYPKYRTAEPD